MKVAGMKMTDPWASRVLRNKRVETELITGAPVETVVQMERVAIEHYGSEKNYRPLLHLTGELSAIRPSESLPHGVKEVTFRSGTGPTVDAFYEFDDAQLGQLVAKGYFTEGFQVPSSMAGIPWELPTTIDALVLSPEHEDDTPVVFVNIHGQTELALNVENSGYDLAEYFENQLTPDLQRERALENVAGVVPTRSGEINDLFAADEFQAPGAGELRDAADRIAALGHSAAGEYPVVRASIFDDLMAEIGSRLPAHAEANEPTEDDVDIEQQAAEDLLPDAAEALYRERISPGVSEALARTTEAVPEPEVPKLEETRAAAEVFEAPATKPGPGLLDLDEEPEELGVVPFATAPAADPVWTPETDSLSDAEATAASEAGTGSGNVHPTQRRVQRARAHEQALELAGDDSDEPQLG